MLSATRFIEEKLRLVVNVVKSSVRKAFDRTFLGFHSFWAFNLSGVSTWEVRERGRDDSDLASQFEWTKNSHPRNAAPQLEWFS